ncbi:hypothetical protein LEP3755_16770 [Leptolyngbya sp. NIES-3755]|nr:hypothetical protein LEP3755_16770 [Leptolyngbya sp. NIES-3755]
MLKDSKSLPTIFICYARKNNEDPDFKQRWLDKLLEHLKPLEYQNEAIVWCDHRLETGEFWDSEIRSKLQAAKVAIALLSPAFFASRYIRFEEMPLILQQVDQGKTTLLPILLSACDVEGSTFRYDNAEMGERARSLSEFQASNGITQPLMGLPEYEQDQILLRVAERARELVTGKNRKRSTIGSLGTEAPIQRMPRGTETFVGREDVLTELHNRLQTEDAIAICAVSGMGGIGKTELALQYVLRHQRSTQYPGKACWIDARQIVGSQIVEFARVEFGIVPPELPDLKRVVEKCWEQFPAKPTLIVFDDVQAYSEIKDFLPPKESRFKVLLTTRAQMPSEMNPLRIEVLTETAAFELLRRLVADGRIDQELETVKRVCQWLGYLPLGLELVGRYLARKLDTTVAELEERLRDKRLAAKPLTDTKGEITASQGVAAAFELSWRELEEPAQEVAKLLSGFAVALIRWEWVEACWKEEEERELEDLRDEALLGSHLLTRVERGVYQLHPLLREFFVSKMTREEREQIKTVVAMVMIEIARKIPQTPTLAMINAVTVAIPHLQLVAKNLMELESRRECSISEDEDLIWVFVGVSRFYEGQGLYADAEPWFVASLKVSRSLFGGQHPNVANSLNNLALLYESQGRYEQAERLFLQALELRQALFGEQHPDIANSLNNLALLYESQGQFDQAEQLCLQALELYRSLLGEQHPSVATTLNNLAALYQLQGRFDQAEPLLLQALEIRQALLGEQHLDVAISLNNLALLYKSQGRFNQAERLYLQAYELTRSLLSEQHPYVASSFNNLAALYQLQGRFDQAEQFYLQALQIDQQALGQEHPGFAIDLHNLAGLYSTVERYAEAEPLYLQALTIFFNRLGEAHPSAQMAWRGFIELLVQVLQSDRTSELSDHPLTRSMLQQLQSASE